MIRSNASEDLGGLFVEPSVNTTLEPIDLTQNAVVTHPYTGVTLYNADPARRVRQGATLDLVGEVLTTALQFLRLPRPIFAPGPISPRAALELILNNVGVPFTAPLPEFALRSSTGLIYPTLGALTISWDVLTDDAPSVRDVLEEFFAPFTGYVFRANAVNRLEVIAPPWASNTAPALTLRNEDILDGDWNIVEDETDIVNLCVVRSRGWSFVEAQQVAQDAIGEFGYRGKDASGGSQNIGTVPEVFRNAWVATNAYAVDDAVLFNSSRYRCRAAVGAGGASPTVDGTSWEVSRFDARTDISSSNLIPLDANIYTSGPLLLDIECRVVTGFRNFFGTWIVDEAVTVKSITLPEDGTPVDIVLPFDRGMLYVPRFYDNIFKARRVAQGVQFTPYVTLTSPAAVGTATTWIGFRFRFIATGNKWQKSKDTSIGRFGESINDAELPGLPLSRAAYGVRQRSIDLGVYQLTAAQCLEIARSVVETNLNADFVSSIGIAPPWRVTPDQLGRAIGLPDGTVGTLEGWSLSEAHAPGSSATRVTAIVRVEDRLTKTIERDSAFGTSVYGSSRYL